MYTLRTLSAAASALGVALALWAPVASAGLINQYDFVASNGNKTTVAARTFASGVPGGTSVIASGFLNEGGNWVNRAINIQTNAIGVNSTLSRDGSDANPGQVGPRLEGVQFDLQSSVFGVFQIDFALFGGTDRFDIWASTSDIIASNFVGATNLSTAGTSNPFISGAMAFQYIFVTNSAESAACGGGGSCFRIDTLSVVPEPGSLALAGCALLLAGAVRRRRQDSR